MTITPEQHTRIRQLYFAEHWKVGTIVAELGLHPEAVERAIETPRFGNRADARRPSMLDPYKPLIVHTLEQYPRLRSSRLHQMLQARGYCGGIATVRRYVREVRPDSSGKEAFLNLQTLPGEQGQVDWAHFGKLLVGSMRRPLMLFVMVLSWSRALFARFFLDQRTDNFLRGHAYAFEYFRGVPRELLFDNLKSVVVERVGAHVRFSPQVLELASHYCFAPKPCAPYRGNEKEKWSARSNTSAPASSLPEPTAISTTSTNSFRAGARTSRTSAVARMTAKVEPSLSASMPSDSICWRCHSTASSATSLSRSVAANAHTSALIAMTIRSHTP